MKIFALSALVLVSGGCAHVDTHRFCTAVANKQYSEYRLTTQDDPPLRPSLINDLIANCIDDLR